MYRTHTCNQLNEKDDSKKVMLCGWVNRRRDHGGVIFIDLRDRYGLTQIVSDPVNYSEAHNLMNSVRSEYVIKVEGIVRMRPKNQENLKLDTGKIEVLVTNLEILNPSKTPPFEIDQDKEVSEELRLAYRYLDLRRARMQNNIILRYKIIKFIRDFLDKENFLEIETPILIKGTPEGSREYLVPSRLYPGSFYVLPQSPQQLKQLLMVANFDRYFQIARCFRDEDQRGDRQPEFTQLDLEMSFVEVKDVMDVNERLFIAVTKEFKPQKKIQKIPFPILTYKDAMNLYGSDKPDLRFELPLADVTDIVKDCNFSIFKSAAEKGGVIKALRIEGGASYTRKEISDLEEIAKIHGAKGLVYIILDSNGPKSPIIKYFNDSQLKSIFERCGVLAGDLILFTADTFVNACTSLGACRLEAAKKLNLYDENVFAFCWVIDFPMFEYNEEEKRLDAVHHPFTSPKNAEEFYSHPENSEAKAYDLVLNGNEIAGGSIRIHDEKIQKKVFDILGISDDEAEQRFGHMLEAFKYGAPPHGGIAWGLDRLVMLFAEEPNIREVIAFPKDQKAKDLMLGAPSKVPKKQLDELCIKVMV